MRKSTVFFLCLAAKVAMASGGAGGAGGADDLARMFDDQLTIRPPSGGVEGAARGGSPDDLLHLTPPPLLRLDPPLHCLSIIPPSGKLRGVFVPLVQAVYSHVAEAPKLNPGHWWAEVSLPNEALAFCAEHGVVDRFIPLKLGSEGPRSSVLIPVELISIEIKDPRASGVVFFHFTREKDSGPNSFLGHYAAARGYTATSPVSLRFRVDTSTT
jgi:hypothetical protein